MTSIGVDSPRAIRIGFSTLSMTGMTIRRSVRSSAGPVSLVAQAQMMTGNTTGNGPTCTMQKHQHEKCGDARSRDVEQGQDQAGEQRLQHGDADHPARNVSDRRCGQVDEALATLGGDAACEDLDLFSQPRSGDEEEARDQHRHRKPEHPETDASDLADDRTGRRQQWRAEALHRGFEVDGGEGPRRMDFFADHRPLPHGLRRSRHDDASGSRSRRRDRPWFRRH